MMNQQLFTRDGGLSPADSTITNWIKTLNENDKVSFHATRSSACAMESSPTPV
jgi:hypothetical protein